MCKNEHFRMNQELPSMLIIQLFLTNQNQGSRSTAARG